MEWRGTKHHFFRIDVLFENSWQHIRERRQWPNYFASRGQTNPVEETLFCFALKVLSEHIIYGFFYKRLQNIPSILLNEAFGESLYLLLIKSCHNPSSC